MILPYFTYSFIVSRVASRLSLSVSDLSLIELGNLIGWIGWEEPFLWRYSLFLILQGKAANLINSLSCNQGLNYSPVSHLFFPSPTHLFLNCKERLAWKTELNKIHSQSPDSKEEESDISRRVNENSWMRGKRLTSRLPLSVSLLRSWWTVKE